ncbi:S8 family serine peptidase [Aliikangiella coralliicola]|uniref:S8 family serine peptidase n=1 Tax=Aliikangiella coralliicola TaxID=2592383 RepID=A0A545TS10_9GAMM|nr:S8 family serine peptidase [Aliikangiella coralliicola]TQV80003.1 S8 family serine peptidase [Aliikangiella coralliicola]
MKKNIVATAVGVAITGTAFSVVADNSQPTYSADDLSNVHNQCIVRLKDNATDVPGLAKGLLKKANQMNGKSASIKHTYQRSIKGFTMTMPCSAAEKALGKDANIHSLTPDSIVSVSKGKPGGGGGSQPQTTPWSVTRVGGAADGSGYTAWVIDTGIDLDHQDLNVDSSRGFSAFTKGRNAGMDDKHGHGTHVAGTIGAIDNSIDVIGVAAGATVVPVKVLDARGSGSNSGVIAGVEHVAANASPGDCVNMSLGGGVSSALDDAVKNAAQSSGAYFVLAAGNDGDHANNHSPARANGNRIYTISATDSNDNMPSWSNYGNPPVDYAAPGVSILSTRMGGGTTTMSGTSMAAPAACAVIMLRNGNPGTDGSANNDPDGNPDPIVHL